MAEYISSPATGAYGYESDTGFTSASSPNPLTTMTNVAGAVVSLALVIGIGVWGYKLLVRDVSGIPVVRAASGEMRVRPEDPGGQLAQHQGLSVNVVAAEGTAARPADQLRLAPKPVDLTADDIVAPAALVVTAQQNDEANPLDIDVAQEINTPDVAAALEAGNVDELVAQLTAGIAPLEDLNAPSEEVVASVTETVVAEVKAAQAQVSAILDAPGVRQSLRPKKRPSQRTAVVPASFEAPSVAEPAELDPNSLPAGTRLAQLGAFDSAEVAREQWVQLSGRFGPYLQGKKRIIQKATSGGRVFYRLRAHGFEDIADARRFCSALVAENADCIPVVTR